MTIEPITKAEFGAVPTPKRLLPESVAVQALAVEEGVKFPCKWEHAKGQRCASHSTFAWVGRRNHMKFLVRCYNKVVYVWRIE